MLLVMVWKTDQYAVAAPDVAGPEVRLAAGAIPDAALGELHDESGGDEGGERDGGGNGGEGAGQREGAGGK